jgi:hypothetical protein
MSQQGGSLKKKKQYETAYRIDQAVNKITVGREELPIIRSHLDYIKSLNS